MPVQEEEAKKTDAAAKEEKTEKKSILKKDRNKAKIEELEKKIKALEEKAA